MLRPALAGHRSSSKASTRTREPASRASRTSSSLVLPVGTESRAPSLRASTAPSTATVSTVRGYATDHRLGPFRRGVVSAHQRSVSAEAHGAGVPDNDTASLSRLIGDHPDAPAEVLARAPTSTCTPLLVAAAILTGDLHHLTRAAGHATTTRDRQLLAVADAHLRGNADLLHVLIREHLCEHPDHLIAAWIAGRATPSPDPALDQPASPGPDNAPPTHRRNP